MLLSTEFWHGRRVLVTGHTGFKGSWLTCWLHRLGADVVGCALQPETEPSLYVLAGISSLCDSHLLDIREAERIKILVRQCRPEVVFHLAAQPLVRVSYREPLKTFSTNVMGTANLLDALRGVDSVKVAVVITTDKVYRNLEWPYPYREDDELGGHDPYSASKAASEIVTSSYRKAFLDEQDVALATARSGNVIGGGDWSEDRLIPDSIRSWSRKEKLEIRRPDAVRPWQHVMEPLLGYLRLAESLWNARGMAEAYNFGPDTGDVTTVRTVIEMARDYFGRGEVVWGDGSEGPHEAGFLALENVKARVDLDVSPRWSLAKAVECTMAWYRNQLAGRDARELCEADIATYEESGE
jgi:CDP-glucose 4,6-dehydratase